MTSARHPAAIPAADVGARASGWPAGCYENERDSQEETHLLARDRTEWIIGAGLDRALARQCDLVAQ
jgi:hypothetical protein